MSRARIGVIGAGYWASYQYLPFYRDHPETRDLNQGPLLNDDLRSLSTHFDPIWGQHMYGKWGYDPRAEGDEPFEIGMQGLGVFTCLREAWLGFNPRFRGFGGEEFYIHEKFRQAGRRTLCLPFLRWTHRFGRPSGVPYPLYVDDKFRNYLIGHAELGLPLLPIVEHFSQHLPAEKIPKIYAEAIGVSLIGLPPVAPAPSGAANGAAPAAVAAQSAAAAANSEAAPAAQAAPVLIRGHPPVSCVCLTYGRPHLLVVEDAHWADEATLDLLRHLARRIHGCHALVMVSYRPEDTAAGENRLRERDLSGVARHDDEGEQQDGCP